MRFVSMFVIILIPAIVVADYGYEEWAREYNGPGDENDMLLDIEVDLDGNVYVTGHSYGSGTDRDYCTIKYDGSGNEVWVARYDGPANDTDTAIDMALDSDGYIYVTGCSKNVYGDYDSCTIKYDSQGNEVWVKRYDCQAGGDNVTSSIAIDNQNYIYVAGYETDIDGNWDYCLIKYDSYGNLVWIRNYEGANCVDDLELDEEGYIYVTGYLFIEDEWNVDYCTIKYDSDGNDIWVSTYDGPTNDFDRPYAGVEVDSEGNVYVSGKSYGYQSSDFCTVKYDSEGNELWVDRYGDMYEDYPYDMVLDSEGFVYVTGRLGIKWADDDICTLKYDSDGNLVWDAIHNSEGYNDYAMGVTLDGYGNIYVTGVCDIPEEGSDACTIKYNENGEEMWVAMYDGEETDNDFDSGHCIALDSENNIYVGGMCNGYGEFIIVGDYLITKYAYYTDITLLSFTADPSGASAVNLRWSISADEGDNILGFNLYRRELQEGAIHKLRIQPKDVGEASRYNLPDWHKVNSTIITGTNPYSYTDTGVAENTQYEYKLEAVMGGEGSETLGTTTVETGEPASFGIVRLYPLPTSDTLNCTLSVPGEQNIEIQLYDLSGRKVMEKIVKADNMDKFTVELDVSNLSSGVYTLKANAGDMSDSKRVLVVR